MNCFAPEQKTCTRTLGANQHFDVTFAVVNPGLIQVLASTVLGASPAPASGIRRRVEIFAPGVTVPVVSQEDPGAAFVTTLTCEAARAQTGDGLWTARITNLENRTAQFRLQAAFPGTIPLKGSTVPSALVDTFVNNTLKQIHVRITRGEDASYIEFPQQLQVPDQHFTVEDLKRTVNLLLLKIQLVEFPNDINSSSILFSLQNASAAHPNGSMRMQIAFEEAGRDILGSFHVELSNVLLTIDLDLDVEGRRLTYDTVSVKASFDVNIVGLPDVILSAIFQYEEYLERRVADAVRAAFSRVDVRAAISDALMAGLEPVIGPNVEIASVKVEESKLSIQSFAVRQLAAA